MENKLNGLDIENKLGTIDLPGGGSFAVPNISIQKIIKIAKFIGIDGIRIYDNVREILIDDENFTFLERIATVIEQLDDRQLVRILAILLEISDEEALKADVEIALDIGIIYAEGLDLGKLYGKVQVLVKAMFKRDLPDLKDLADTWFPKVEAETEDEKTKQKEAEPQA